MFEEKKIQLFLECIKIIIKISTAAFKSKDYYLTTRLISYNSSSETIHQSNFF